MNPFARWLDLPDGRLPTMQRAVGALLLIVLSEVTYWSHNGPGPYHVPAFRLNGVSLDLPLPPVWLDGLLWLVYIAAASAMMFGSRSWAWPALAAALLGYYGWRDARACNSAYLHLLFTYLLAFLFASGPVHCARRLIQCSLTACYAFSVIQKSAMPEWRDGHTLANILRHGDGVRPLWVPVLEGWPQLAELRGSWRRWSSRPRRSSPWVCGPGGPGRRRWSWGSCSILG